MNSFSRVFHTLDFVYLVCEILQKRDLINIHYLTKQLYNENQFVESRYSKLYVNNRHILKLISSFKKTNLVEDPVLYILDANLITPRIIKTWLESKCYFNFFEIVIRITSYTQYETLCCFMKKIDDIFFMNRIVFDMMYYESFDVPPPIDVRFKRLENTKPFQLSGQYNVGDMFQEVWIINQFGQPLNLSNCRIRQSVILSKIFNTLNENDEYEITIDHFNIHQIINSKINLVGITIDLKSIVFYTKQEANSFKIFVECMKLLLPRIQYVKVLFEFPLFIDFSVCLDDMKELIHDIASRLISLNFHSHESLSYFDQRIMHIKTISRLHPQIKFAVHQDWINYYYCQDFDRYTRFGVNISFHRVHIECSVVDRDSPFCQEESLKYLENQVIAVCVFDHLLYAKVKKFKFVSEFFPFRNQHGK